MTVSVRWDGDVWTKTSSMHTGSITRPRGVDASRLVRNLRQHRPKHALQTTANHLRTKRSRKQLVCILLEQSASACAHIDDQLSALGCTVQGAAQVGPGTDPVSPVHSRLAAVDQSLSTPSARNC